MFKSFIEEFKRADKKGQGKLNLEEIVGLLSDFGVQLSAETLKAPFLVLALKSTISTYVHGSYSFLLLRNLIKTIWEYLILASFKNYWP